MGKLHELLAVEGSRKEAFKKILSETGKVFAERQTLFTASIRTYEPFAAEDDGERGVVERHDMTTTVKERLRYVGELLVPYIDTVYQKELTNQQAKGTIVVDGKTVAKDVPVSCLLNLESTLAIVRDQFNLIPTHAAGVEWIPDTDFKFPGVLKSAHAELAYRTKKIIKPFELSPATKEHKAQVEKLTEDKVVGKLLRDMWSGQYSPAEKSDILGRLDRLIEACRVARMQANDIDHATSKIGEAIYAVILPLD